MPHGPATIALSVVIPTRDRREVLVRTLDALARQEGAPPFEVIVIDDGSQDDTTAMLDSRHDEAFELHHERQPPRGPAAARNRAIAMARGDRVLLLGDDTWPAPGTLRAHLTAGDTGGGAAAPSGVGVQGRIEWDTDVEITAVMRFLAPAGPQFYFAGMIDGAPIPYTAMLGSNFSAPTAWFRDQPFDETFPDASFEDTELAYRWRQRGHRSIYSSEALCWHHHVYAEIEPFLARQQRAGRAARHAVRRHPKMAWRAVISPTVVGGGLHLARLIGRALRGASTETTRWDLRCRWAFLRGFLS